VRIYSQFDLSLLDRFSFLPNKAKVFFSLNTKNLSNVLMKKKTKTNSVQANIVWFNNIFHMLKVVLS